MNDIYRHSVADTTNIQEKNIHCHSWSEEIINSYLIQIVPPVSVFLFPTVNQFTMIKNI